MPAADLQRRFAGLERLYGVAGAQRIRAAHVVVVGLGGVGSWTAEALARSGVGALTLIDLDHVTESNINRQVHAVTATLGQAKVQAMAERIAGIHPACRIHAVDDFLTPGNLLQLLPAGLDAVVDACDQRAAKVALAAWARGQLRPFISVGAAGGKRQGQRVQVADLCAVTHDRLLARVRYELRRNHGAPTGGRKLGVPCVFSDEAARSADACGLPAQDDGSLNCHGYGSTVAVTATFGLCAAGWVLEQLAART